jgi:DNA polymerase III epsilon subunit-like protein
MEIDTSKFLRYLNFNYLVFDYETCNLNLQSSDNKPWQVSYLLKSHIAKKGKSVSKELKRGDFYLKWNNLVLSEGAERATGFSRKKYNLLAKNPKPILDELDDMIYDEDIYIVGHNLLGFDIYIHNIFRKLLNKPIDYSFAKRVLDTHALSKLYKIDMIDLQGRPITEWQLKILNVRTRGIKTNVKAMCKDLDIKVDDSQLHNAMYDVEKTDEIFLKLLWKING